MFGSKRKRATKHTLDIVAKLISSHQKHQGLPAWFWDDEFVIGYIGFMIVFHSQITSNIQLSQIDKGRVLAEVFSNVSNMDDISLARKYASLSGLTVKNEEFERGQDYAAILCNYVFLGENMQIGKDLISKAEAVTAKYGMEGARESIGAALLFLSFNQVIIDKDCLSQSVFTNPDP